MSDVVGFPIARDSDTTLQKLIRLNMNDHLQQFESISEHASKEHSLERTMEKMMLEWDDVSESCDKLSF